MCQAGGTSTVQIVRHSLGDRFKSHRFSVHNDSRIHTSQVFISVGDIWLLSAYVALPCDHIYPGCTRRYQGGVSLVILWYLMD